MIAQTEFDKFVKDYNDDYLLLLKRASKQHYECLISAFMVLKDFYNLIHVIYDSGQYTYKVLPYPLSFRADEVVLKQLNFDNQEIQNIFGFLDHVKATQGLDFEDCLQAGTVAMCARV